MKALKNPTHPLLLALLFALCASFAAGEAVAQEKVVKPRATSPKKKKKPKKKKRATKKRRPRGSGAYLRWGIGIGGCVDSSALCPESVGVGFTPLDLELGYRAGLIAGELHTTIQPFSVSEPTSGSGGGGTTDNDALSAYGWGIFGGLKLLPLQQGPWDLTIGLRLGYMETEVPNVAPQGGFGVGGVFGVDYFFTRGFAMGLSSGIYSLQSGAEAEGSSTIMTGRLSVIFYWELLGGGSSGGSSSPSKPKPKRPSY